MNLLSLIKFRKNILPDRSEKVKDALDDFIYIMKWGLSSNSQILNLSSVIHNRFLLWQKWFFEENAKNGILGRIYDESTKGIQKMSRPVLVDSLDWSLINNLMQGWETKIRNDKEFNKLWLGGLKQGYNSGGRAFLSYLGIRRPDSSISKFRIGASFNLKEPLVLDMMQRRVNLLRPEVDDFTFKQVKSTILDSYYNKGEHPYDTARRLRGVFDETYHNRARTIARTETNWAMSEANLESMKRAEIQFKKWLTTQNACDECASLNKEVVEVNQPFSNGWDSPADAHPCCRCAISPAMRKGEKPSRYWDGESLNVLEETPEVVQIPQLGRLPGDAVSFDVEPYTAVPRSSLADKTTLEMREMCKTNGIKYFRVMNREELVTVLTDPSKATEIGQIARARWMKTGPKIPLPAKTQVQVAATELEKKTTAELMQLAHAKNIPNFRVMRKTELVSVLSNPAKYDEIQQAVKARLRAARGIPGKQPGTTQADELGLTDVEARRKESVDKILFNAQSEDESVSDESFRKNIKDWLEYHDVETLEAASKKGLRVGLYKKNRDVWWAHSSNFSGVYQPGTHRIGLSRLDGGFRADVFNHEMGHFISDEVDAYRSHLVTINNETTIELRIIAERSLPEGSKAKGWKESWKDIRDETQIISRYACHSSSENFSEALKLYMKGGTAAEKLKRVAPKLYNAIQKYIFKGKRF